MRKGRAGEVYNVGGNSEYHNIDIVKLILKRLDKPESLIEFVTDRPGHDLRYAINASKIRDELGWEPTMDFENGINHTIAWYLEHETWWQRIKSGEYMSYYEQWYGNRSTCAK
jgi:dTDP-glucose 4,6-dehydratase